MAWPITQSFFCRLPTLDMNITNGISPDRLFLVTSQAPIIAAAMTALAALTAALLTFLAFLFKERTRIAIRTQVLDSIKKELDVREQMLKLMDTAGGEGQDAMKAETINRMKFMAGELVKYGTLDPRNPEIDSVIVTMGLMVKGGTTQARRLYLKGQLSVMVFAECLLGMLFLSSLGGFFYGIYSAWTKWSIEPLQLCLLPLIGLPISFIFVIVSERATDLRKAIE